MTRILVVEDESIIAADLKDCLEGLGYSVIATVATGSAAIQTAAEEQPDLVLMDIRLKGRMDGIQAAEQIWQHCQIPIIYTTGYSDRSTVDRAKATGPFGYILKPIDEKELYVAIETALQRHQLNLEIKKREQWLDTVLRDIGDAVIVVDLEEQVKFLNPAAQALTGWTEKTDYEPALTDVLQSVKQETGEPLHSPILETLQSGMVVSLAGHTLLVSKAETALPSPDRAVPFHQEDGPIAGVVLVFRDITERHLAEEHNRALERAKQLEEKTAELQRLNQLKDDFLNTISHELRTPLASIRMAIRMLEIALGQLGIIAPEGTSEPEMISRYLRILNDQCDQELNLVNDLLDLQRLNSDAYPLEWNIIHLQDWLPHLLEGFQIRAQHAQQVIHTHFASSLPPLVSDMQSLTRIFTELLNNACKYTPPEGEILVTVDPYKPYDDSSETMRISYLRFRICNSGVEISAEECAHIFEPFYRVRGIQQQWQEGTGLGLSLVQKLVIRLGGVVAVESQANQTCFDILLPIRPLEHLQPAST